MTTGQRLCNSWIRPSFLFLLFFVTALSALSSSSPHDFARRRFLSASTLPVLLSAAAPPPAASAGNPKSRSVGYTVQKPDSEWRTILSPIQYQILRLGGTEPPNYSILESEDRPGRFVCAGCGTPLFESNQKFHSGTGWPSFARALGEGVEVEVVNPVQRALGGAELRCRVCGGHLGDVFGDGYLFVGTPAFQSGQRFCIDGAAMVFEPEDGSLVVRGDTPKPKEELPAWLQPPGIKGVERKAI